MGIKDWFTGRPRRHALWPRPSFQPGGRQAEGEFFLYSNASIPIALGEALRPFGHPDEPQRGVGIRTDSRLEVPDAFDSEASRASFAQLIEINPSLASNLASAQFRHVIIFDEQDPKDLGYLQGAWAAVRYFMHHGAFAAYDLRMQRWRTSSEVLGAPVDDPTQACGWRVVVENESTSVHGCLVYTHGLAKFGRPDMIAAAPRDEVNELAQVINLIAADFASGRRPISGEPSTAHGGKRLVFEAYIPGFVLPPRDFFNDEVVHVRVA